MVELSVCSKPFSNEIAVLQFHSQESPEYELPEFEFEFDPQSDYAKVHSFSLNLWHYVVDQAMTFPSMLGNNINTTIWVLSKRS
jgi:hypothetical protein